MKAAARMNVSAELQRLKADAAKGDASACAQLFETALESVRHLEALSRDVAVLATLKSLSGHFNELPTTYQNHAHISAHSETARFSGSTSGERLRTALTSLLPFKVENGKKRGKPRSYDALNMMLQMFVRGVCYQSLQGPLDVHLRVHASGGTAAAWAKEFVSWVKQKMPAQVESPAGAFHKLATNRLTKKRSSQIANKNGRSIDGDNLWPQFQHVVTRRLASILPGPNNPAISG